MLSLLTAPFRLVKLGYVLSREGMLKEIPPEYLPFYARPFLSGANLLARKSNEGRKERLSRALARLGPSYVKSGQFLATRADIVGVALAQDLTGLQDQMPPFAQELVIAQVEHALGKPLAAVFAEFSLPIAAASIAQVHKARLLTGETRAVKLLRPDIRVTFGKEMEGQAQMAHLVERFLPSTRRLKPKAVVAVLQRSVAMELDLRLEAAALSELGENAAQDKDFYVPRVDWDHTARDILCMEWIDGIPLSQTERLIAAGHHLPQLARSVLENFLRHALRDGFFHADMHQGNLFADSAGRIVAVDCGIMGRLQPKERRFLAEILLGFITRDYMRVAEVHFEAGYVPPQHAVADFAQAIRAIGEPIHNRAAEEISMAKLLALLLEVTGLFDMETRTELVMLQKTLVVVEGVARSLDKSFNMWHVAEPVLREFMVSQLNPVQKLREVSYRVRDLADAVLEAPRVLSKTEAMLQRLEEKDAQPVKRAWQTPMLLALIALLLAGILLK